MFVTRLQRSGNDLIVVVPVDEVRRLGLKEGQNVTLFIRPGLSADLQEAFEIERERGQEALRYLADH